MISVETDQRWCELMAKAQKGDSAAYKILLGEILPVIRQFVRRRSNTFMDSEDVAQEILMAVHKARHTHTPGKKFAPWMFAIARHKIVDYLRRHIRTSKREVATGEDVEAVAAEPVAVEATGTESIAVEEALSGLKPMYREVIQLTKFEGLTTKEAAEKLGITESALKVRAHRAYEVLRKKLEKALYDDK